MSRQSPPRDRLPEHDLVARAIAGLHGRKKVFVVKAPPGSGKTTLLLGVLRTLLAQGRRLAVGTQTNSQADDLCERWVRHGLGPITRLVATGDDTQRPGPIDIRTSGDTLPHGPCVVVANTKKWAFAGDFEPFDILFVDEAWQMSWADFSALPHVAESFMLIGDPGQIQPIVRVDTSRWETAPVAPHRPAPEVVLARGIGTTAAIDHTWRLPFDTAKLVRGFYDFDFAAKAAPNARRLLVDPPRGGIGDVLAMARDASIVAATRRMPEGGTTPNDDPDLALDVARAVEALLKARAKVEIDGVVKDIDPASLGVVATHRVMLASIRDRLPAAAAGVVCETPERWQGLERPLMLAVHPLSSTLQPSAFDLATGRLCVMASRHKAALMVFSRAHIADTLGEHRPEATQAPSRPDDVGRGHARHMDFWRAIERSGRVARLD